MALTKVPSNLDSVTATTQSQGDGSTNVATTAYVDTGLNALIDSAPGNLNTLNELAAAMNDNASFFSTVLPLSGGTMTGNLTVTSTTASTTGMVRLQNNMDNGYEALRIESLGNYDASIGFFADGSSNYYWGAGIDYSDSGKFKISNDNIVSVNTRLTITTGGNVGIGETNPDASLHITSNTPTIAFDESDASQDWRIGSYGGSFAIYDETDSQFRLVVNGSGNVGIGTTSINANAKLHVQDSSGSYPDDTNNHLVVESASHSYIGIGGGTSSDVGIHMGDSGGINRGKLAYLNASDSMVLFTSAQERMRITSNGSITVGGGGSPRSVGWGDTKFQIEGTSATDSSISLIRNEAGNNPPYFVFAKSRGSSIGSSTVVQNGDDLGTIRWVAADGAGLENQAAQISVQVDNPAGNNDTPGRIMFFTSPDGTNSAIERMRIKSNGNVRINYGSNDYTSHTNVDQYLFTVQTDYNSAGSQNLHVVNHNGNWNDGTTGTDSAYGFMWGYENSIRAGIHYDHRGTEKFDFYSSYAPFRFRVPPSVNGNISPIGSETSMPSALTIKPGGFVGLSTDSPQGYLHINGTSDNQLILDSNSTSANTGIFFRENGANKGELYWRGSSDDFRYYNYTKNAAQFVFTSAGHSVFYGSHQGDNVGTWLFSNQHFGDAAGVNCTLMVKNSNAQIQIMPWTTLGARIGTRGGGWNSNSNNSVHLTSNDTVNIILNTNGSPTLANGTAISSDERLKKNITDIESGQLAKINALRPRIFEWKDERKPGTQEGFIAQEVESVMPEAVEDRLSSPDPDDTSRDFEGDIKVLKHEVLNARLIKAVQELSAELEAAKARITALEG